MTIELPHKDQEERIKKKYKSNLHMRALLSSFVMLITCCIYGIVERPDRKKAWALWTTKTDEAIALDIKGSYKMYNNRGEELSDGDISEMRITPSVIYIIGAKEVSLR